MIEQSFKPILDLSKFSSTERHFLNIVEPIITQKMKELLMTLNQRYNSIIDVHILPPQYMNLIANKLILFISRAAIFELKLAKEANELSGNTPSQRFDSFFLQFDVERFWLQYPVLKRIVDNTLSDFNTYLLEIFDNYSHDWHLLFPQSNTPPKITSFNMDITDVYPKGRCVAILTFQNKVKWVYKPRNMDVDNAFQDFLLWFNSVHLFTPFKTLKIYPFDTYSWSEYVCQSISFSPDSLENAYRKAGCLMCFFHIFNTTDMHSKNIILVGDSPMCIDLETFLQPQTSNDTPSNINNSHFLPQKNKPIQPDDADLEYAYTQKIKNWDNKKWTESKELCWQNEGQDTMSIIRRRQLISVSDKRLKVNGQAVSPLLYLNTMIKSFRKTYRFIEANKEAFLAAITQFEGVKIRIIERSVKKYAALIEEMSHPAILEKEAHLMQHLNALDYESEGTDFEKIIISEEKKYFKNLTYPIFTAFTDDRALLSNGKTLIPNYFEVSALQAVQNKMGSLCEEDLNKQIRIIKKHFNYLKTQ
jgi:type 2 lantibiotic biosynthesis protein LanM